MCPFGPILRRYPTSWNFQKHGWRLSFLLSLIGHFFPHLLSQVLAFLHEHRIAHQDFIFQNTGINHFGNFNEVRLRKGLRNPAEVQYALYDFGHSILYPEYVDIDNVETTRFIRFNHGESPQGPYNPFKADVAMLGGSLQRIVRVSSIREQHIP